MSKVYTRRDIPADQVDRVVKMFTDDGCEVEKIEQPDGKWTVKATCPDTRQAADGDEENG